MRARVPDAVQPAQAPAAGAGTPEPVYMRRVFLSRSARWSPVPVFERKDLFPGWRISGPVVVEDYGSTCLADEGDVLEVGALGELSIAVAAAQGAAV